MIMFKYLILAGLAWARGFFICPYKCSGKWSVSCEVSGPISDRTKMIKQGWKPYIFRKSLSGGTSRFWEANN